MTDSAQAAVTSLFELMAPGLFDETKKLESGENKLIHYTSAENAIKIIRGKQFWLRNVRCMNDYSEVQHGIEMVLRVFQENENARRERLVTIFDNLHEGVARAAISSFDEWLPHLPNSVFIGCLSQYDPNDAFGRLSMWRAYSAAGAGVGLVLNTHPFLAETNELKAYSLPVPYLGDLQFAYGVDKCLDALELSINKFSGVDYDSVHYLIFWWLLCLSVSLKHPAFYEEREWRIVYIPSMDRSKIIVEEVETIRGIAQVVQKIPLIDEPEQGLIGADIPSLLSHVLIGPSEFPLVARDAFIRELESAGIGNAAERVSASFIPLRE